MKYNKEIENFILVILKELNRQLGGETTLKEALAKYNVSKIKTGNASSGRFDRVRSLKEKEAEVGAYGLTYSGEDLKEAVLEFKKYIDSTDLINIKKRYEKIFGDFEND